MGGQDPADLFGILGGLIIGVVGLDLTAFTYIQQTERSLDIFDIVSSLVKSGFFAMFISSIACQRGFAVRGGPEGVGASTTSAMVVADTPTIRKCSCHRAAASMPT